MWLFRPSNVVAVPCMLIVGSWPRPGNWHSTTCRCLNKLIAMWCPMWQGVARHSRNTIIYFRKILSCGNISVCGQSPVRMDGAGIPAGAFCFGSCTRVEPARAFEWVDDLSRRMPSGTCSGITMPPRQWVQAVAGPHYVELNEADICCGSAGSYNLTEPEMAARLQLRKTSHIRQSKALLGHHNESRVHSANPVRTQKGGSEFSSCHAPCGLP